MVKDAELAILFADVVASTRLLEVMGDLRARDVIATCIDIMRVATENQGGTVIKTMGDEVMSTFTSADAALNAAGQMQARITERSEFTVEGHPVAIRIGCHFGPCMVDSRDVFGASVHTANRVTSQAKAGQIMTTAATVDRLSPEWRDAVRQVDVASLRGQGNEITMYEVLWQAEDVTHMLPAMTLAARDKRQHTRLRLQANGVELLVDDFHNRVALGRAEDNDVVVQGRLVSRLHARIELQRSRFMLTDQSINGTFVQIKGHEELFVRRDSVELSGEGFIGLGRLPDHDAPQTIRFACESD
jgi:class 3 adenylate cyclase